MFPIIAIAVSGMFFTEALRNHDLDRLADQLSPVIAE
jgi:hypothetical protein